MKSKHHQQGARATVLGKAGATRRIILQPISSHHPSACLQSAYRKLHSTGTVLLKIISEMFDAVNLGRTTILIALNLSAAFNTIDKGCQTGGLRATSGLSSDF